jgi:hypothetical protein
MNTLEQNPSHGAKGPSVKSKWHEVKLGLLSIPVCLMVVAAPPVFAQDQAQDSEDAMEMEDKGLDELLRKIEAEDDGDDDVPVKVRKPIVHPKLITTYGAKQSLRWKLNKDAFIDAYVDEGVGTQNNPYKSPTSKFTGGLSANYAWNGFNVNGLVDIKRNYTGTYSDWDGVIDKTFSLSVSRKFKLSKEWSLTPSLKQTSLLSDKKTKELYRTDLVMPFSYALNKQWTLKAFTLALSTQTFTGRAEAQTDRTRTVSTGLNYKWSEKSSFDLTLSREQRNSNQSFSEYVRTSIMPKYDYKLSATSSLGVGLGYETHSNKTETFSRYVLVPKVQLRWDI